MWRGSGNGDDNNDNDDNDDNDDDDDDDADDNGNNDDNDGNNANSLEIWCATTYRVFKCSSVLNLEVFTRIVCQDKVPITSVRRHPNHLPLLIWLKLSSCFVVSRYEPPF